ncbi:MAG TPA: porin family protein [Flavobacteriaceae bacterium]|nr:porin family protein [Flavobacteriaceae bacterium]
MKRATLAFLAIFFIAYSGSSQELDLGLKAGANFANINGADDFNYDSKTGFLAGAFFAVKFNDKFAIQPELLYSQQGADFDLGEFDLSYVNVPIILKYYLVKGLNIQVGPQFGFVVDDNLGEIFDDFDNNDFDTSGVVGLGYDFPFGIRLDARYNFGLTEISDNGGKNSVVSLAVGFSFL